MGNTFTLSVTKGTCYALFAYDIGLSINLDEAERHITAIKQRSRIRHKRRAPQYFDYRPAPLRVTQESNRSRLPTSVRRQASIWLSTTSAPSP